MNFKKQKSRKYFFHASVIGHWSLATGHQPALGSWLLNIGYWLFSFLPFLWIVPTGRKMVYSDDSIKLFSNFGLPSTVFLLILAP